MALMDATRPDQSQRRGLASHLGPTLHAAAATGNGAAAVAVAAADAGGAAATAPPPPQTLSAFASASGPSFSSLPSSSFASATNPAAAQLKRGSLPASSAASSRTAQIARHIRSYGSSATSSTSNQDNNDNNNKMSGYTVRKVGAPYTLDHRVYIEKDGVPISPFHDIPLFANQEQTILNMIVEIPRWTNAKLEVRA
ncbi:hypothetical protein VTJ49DRAFT_2329 [Mycothermus thermophilus]|uniref:inorganic diphosphatase n=1 Tax=Humicola insolens TaxID=85995 RepID=A0ABR3VQT1_HUMIN